MKQSQVLKTFLEYVQISSESRSEQAFATRLAEDLRKIGLRVETDKAGVKANANTGNLYAFLDGDPALEPILFSAHMDTVPPGKKIQPIVCDGVVHSSGDTVLGSDDKSGIAAIVEALHIVVEQNIPHRPVEVAFTISEEVGLLGAKALDYTRFSAKNAIVFDNEGDVGTIVNKAPGHVEILATITGKAAHAGVAPEEGISAIVVAAAAVNGMQLLRIDEETTANIGTLCAAGPNNIVPETIRFSAEVRSHNEQKLHRQCDQIVGCLQDACHRYGACLQYTIEPSYASYYIPESDPLIELLRSCCNAIGAPVSICSTGGGSDANVFNAHGMHAIVVGTGMEKIHGVSEYITVKNLENTQKLALELMKKQ
ncbi:MAG: M20/M25/M40 family metallo-hydrolase [Oscillospiraceae bacterium]|nr:M20/M25/M40 family metallo-hydrolase [Oscillospiraceae bacterium]